MESNGPSLMLMGANGFWRIWWILMDPNRSSWTLMDANGPQWTLISSNGPWWHLALALDISYVEGVLLPARSTLSSGTLSLRGSPLICKLWHYPWTLLIDRTSSHMNALALTLDLLYSEGVVLSASSGLSPGRLILRGTQTFCFRRHGSSQRLILSSGMLILSTGVEPESLKSICLRTLPPKSFGHQNPLRQNTICVLILSTGDEPKLHLKLKNPLFFWPLI